MSREYIFIEPDHSLPSTCQTNTMDILSTSNISLYTVPAAWWLCMIPHAYAIVAYDLTIERGRKSASTKPSSDSKTANNKKPAADDLKFDNTAPRTFMSRVEANTNPALTPALKSRISRADAASQNGYEGLGYFAASVVAANVSLIVVHANEGPTAAFVNERWWVNAYAVGYLVARTVYSVVYTMGVPGPVRALPFYAGIWCASALFVKAGNALRVLVK